MSATSSEADIQMVLSTLRDRLGNDRFFEVMEAVETVGYYDEDTLTVLSTLTTISGTMEMGLTIQHRGEPPITVSKVY